jgi:hypothetical protein
MEITRKFVEALNKKFRGVNTSTGPIEFSSVYNGRRRGQSFDKIILPHSSCSPDGSGTHAFIDRQTGMLYRAASGELPVTDARYDLSNAGDFASAVELADPYGNYLRRNYARKTYAGII